MKFIQLPPDCPGQPRQSRPRGIWDTWFFRTGWTISKANELVSKREFVSAAVARSISRFRAMLRLRKRST